MGTVDRQVPFPGNPRLSSKRHNILLYFHHSYAAVSWPEGTHPHIFPSYLHIPVCLRSCFQV